MFTAPFPDYLSKQWLLERTYHAQLQNGREQKVPAFAPLEEILATTFGVHDEQELQHCLWHDIVLKSAWLELQSPKPHHFAGAKTAPCIGLEYLSPD